MEADQAGRKLPDRRHDGELQTAAAARQPITFKLTRCDDSHSLVDPRITMISNDRVGCIRRCPRERELSGCGAAIDS